MAESKIKNPPSSRDFKLYYWSANHSETTLPVAFADKWNWVVSDASSYAAWYRILLGNLSSHYPVDEGESDVEAAREMLARGLRKSAFERLKSVAAIPRDKLSQVVRIPTRTLDRRSFFKPDESERILRVAGAFQRAIEVLGDLGKARRWFSSPARALGGRTPLEYCDTEPGAREVINILGRLEHGVFT